MKFTKLVANIPHALNHAEKMAQEAKAVGEAFAQSHIDIPNDAQRHLDRLLDQAHAFEALTLEQEEKAAPVKETFGTRKKKK